MGLQRHVAAAGRDIFGVDRVFVFGGGSESTAYSRNDAYDPITNTWDSTSFAPLPTPRVLPTETVGHDCRIYVIGGFTGGLSSLVVYNIVEAYDPATDTWDTSILPLNVARSAAAAATGPNGKIYVFGGHDPNSAGFFSSVEAYDPSTPSAGWTLQTPMPAGHYHIGAELGCDGNIYVMGREESNNNVAFNYRYDPTAGVGGSWSIATPCPATGPALEGRGMTRGPDGRIYLINDGEYNTTGDKRVWSYDPITDTWQAEPDSIRGYKFLAAATLGDRVYAIGGVVRFSPQPRRAESLGPIPEDQCADNPCLGQATGACCYAAGGCSEVPESQCPSEIATYMGDDVPCGGEEACCRQDGTCTMSDSLCCLTDGGQPQGPGSVCWGDGNHNGVDEQCEPTGACCYPFGGGRCGEGPEYLCEIHGGTYQGDGTECQGKEACCLPDGTCSELDAICCEEEGGIPQGPNSRCDTDGDGIDDICEPICDPPQIQCVPDFPCPGGLGSSFPAGDADDFCPAPEPVFIGPELASLGSCASPAKQFDDLSIDRHFCHTVTGLPSNIGSARLEIRMQAGPSGLACNDTLSLQVVGTSFAWSRRIGAPGSGYCSGPPGLLPYRWTPGTAETLCLDLGNLPNADGSFTNILPLLSSTGQLDVRVQDDTGVDYLRVHLVDCPCAEPPAGMVGWWPLDALEDLGVNGDGPDDSREITANNLHGDSVGNPAVARGEMVGNSTCFDGNGDYIEVADNPALNFGIGDFSLDAWIRTTQTAGVRIIADKRVEGSSTTGYSFFLSSGRLAFQIADGGGSSVCNFCPTTASCTNYDAGIVVATGEWEHVAVTVSRTGGFGTFYINGTPVSVFDISCHPNSVTNTNPLRIGSRSSSVSGLFVGCIDELEIFDRELTAGEVRSIYSAGSAGKCKGACCLPDGSCAAMTEQECEALQGQHQGVGSQCLGDNNFNGIDDSCEPTGACCLPDGNCLVTTPQNCEKRQGVYLGDDTICEGPEACCLPDGSCTVVDRHCCEVLFGGTPLGAGTQCLGDADGDGVDDVCGCHAEDAPDGTIRCVGQCPDPADECRLVGADCSCGPTDVTGACCFQDGTCAVATPNECVASGGMYLGDNTMCEGVEACCLPDGKCLEVDALCCRETYGGQPLGPGSKCLGDADGSGTDDACECGVIDEPGMDPYCAGPCKGDATSTDQCVPRCVTFEPGSDKYEIADCDCRGQGECGIDLSVNPPRCVGKCVTGVKCKRRQKKLADGRIVMCCGCPLKPLPGDVNDDGVLTPVDFDEFYECITGPVQVGQLRLDCWFADVDGDENVDLRDFAAFMELRANQ